MRAIGQSAALIAVVSGSLLFQNCSKVDFSAMDTPSVNIRTDTGGPNCRAVLETIQTKIKIIFVIDVSGSNDTTDPDQVVRAGSISRFYNSYSMKSNFGWNAISFAGDAAKVRLQEGTAGTVPELVSWLQSHDDDGGTPYVASLDKTLEMINSLQNIDAQTKYVVVFLSDGRPDPIVADDVLKSEVEQITGTHHGRVSFNTVYYGVSSPENANRLRMMAQIGGGNFLDSNTNSTGPNFSISDLVIVPGEVCDAPVN